MASVERATAMAAAVLLPGLLPSPPRCTMITPCIIILPASSNPKYPIPGRADSVERWDVHKKSGRKPGSPASSCGRADSVERWDIRKKKTDSISSTSPSRVKKWEEDSSKRPPSSRASSADRWDAHKKARPAAQADADQEEQKTIVDKEAQEDERTPKKMIETAARTHPLFSGPSFVASPVPGMLPMPDFFTRRAGALPLPAFVRAH